MNIITIAEYKNRAKFAKSFSNFFFLVVEHNLFDNCFDFFFSFFLWDVITAVSSITTTSLERAVQKATVSVRRIGSHYRPKARPVLPNVAEYLLQQGICDWVITSFKCIVNVILLIYGIKFKKKRIQFCFNKKFLSYFIVTNSTPFFFHLIMLLY